MEKKIQYLKIIVFKKNIMKRIILSLLIILLYGITDKMYAQSEEIWFAIKDGIDNQNLKATLENNTTLFLTACNKTIINKEKPDFSSKIIAKNSLKKLLSFWETTPFYCTKMYISEKCLKKTSGGFQIRNIPVCMPDAPEDSRNQEIVINFTNTGLIDDIAISVNETRYREILNDYSTIEDLGRREIIVDFIENFRTSYNIKDINYIESVFSEQALIITGKVVKIAQIKDAAVNKLLGDEKITYVLQSKAEYIKNLKQTFLRNKYIDIQFNDIEVVKHPKNDFLYGVTLKQLWGSSTYNDSGYIFLLIDFKYEQQPMIHVRTWQPDSFNGKPLSKNEIFNFGNFNIQNL